MSGKIGKTIDTDEVFQAEMGECLDLKFLNSGKIMIELKVVPFGDVPRCGKFLRILHDKDADAYSIWQKCPAPNKEGKGLAMLAYDLPVSLDDCELVLRVKC